MNAWLARFHNHELSTTIGKYVILCVADAAAPIAGELDENKGILDDKIKLKGVNFECMNIDCSSLRY